MVSFLGSGVLNADLFQHWFIYSYILSIVSKTVDNSFSRHFQLHSLVTDKVCSAM